MKPWTGIAIAAAVLALDRLTKVWVEARVGVYDTIVVAPGLFNIVHSENRGMAFGIGNDGATPFTRIVLIAVSLVILGVLAWGFRSARHTAHPSDALALFVVASGALGNLYDRIVYGQVTDFLDVYVGTHHWPTFNVADSAITVGAIWIALNALRERQRTVAA